MSKLTKLFRHPLLFLLDALALRMAMQVEAMDAGDPAGGNSHLSGMQERRFVNRFKAGNKFVRTESAEVFGQIRTRFGTGNVFQIGAGSSFRGTLSIHGSHNRIAIGENCTFIGTILVKGDNQVVSLGDHSTTAEVSIICAEGCNVQIGKWCMLSRQIEIRTTDSHSVICRESGKRLNVPQSVSIGDHVWVALGAIIGKGAVIPNDCIVGTRSFVNKVFDEESVVLAGVPARIIKRGVTWNRRVKVQFSQAERNRWKSIP